MTLAPFNSYAEAYLMMTSTRVADVPADAGAEDSDQCGREADLPEREKNALKFWVKLSRAHSAIAAHASADIGRHGMTLAEFGILEALYHRGPMLLGEVQRRILVSSGGITFLVDRLVSKGLVERRQCNADKRARYAALTSKGECFVGEIFPVHASVIAGALASLSDAELAEASALLRQAGLAAQALSRDEPDSAALNE